MIVLKFISKKKEIIIFIILLLIFSFFISNFIKATSQSSSSNSTLMVWDDTDSEGGGLTKRTYKTNSIYGCWNKPESVWNVHFFANYTNSSGSTIDDGNCKIRFNETGWNEWLNMTYNSSSTLYEYNRSFTYKGILDFQVNCTSNYDNLSVIDNVTITNTGPCIFGRVGGDPNGPLPQQDCSEDTLCYYNFSANSTDDDANDVLTYSYSNGFDGFSMNSTTGFVIINVTNDTNCGLKNITLTVTDNEPAATSASKIFNITAVNDAPQFINLPNELNATQDIFFSYDISAQDEENDVPFHFNVTFINCTKTYGGIDFGDNCSLFNITQINNTAANTNFTPTNDDVGQYWINFTVRDSGNSSEPYNASTSQIVNFTVIDTNDRPNITFACDNTNGTEDSLLSCWVNATDIDELYNLTFSSNYSWFKFNNSQNIITVNVTTEPENYSASALINFTPTDSEVGNWTINITVRDSAIEQRSDSVLRNIFISNVNDSVSLSEIENQTAYVNVQFSLYINATDNDLLIPDESVYDEDLIFSKNITGPNSSLFEITDTNNVTNNTEIALISFTASSWDIGNYTINISVHDKNNYSFSSRIFGLMIQNNSAPVWNDSTPLNHNITEEQNFFLNLSEYVSDPDNDSITFSDNTTPESFPSFSMNDKGIINFTADDEDVKIHYVNITATDDKGAKSSKIFMFNITEYVNDSVTLKQISNVITYEDNETILFINATDNDLLIPDKSIYNESITFTKNITNLTGHYRELFNITIFNIQGNLTQAIINFTPVKDDVGNYTINITVHDRNNYSFDSKIFNLTIIEINHAPNLTSIGNRTTGINLTFYLDVNATDIEDGSDPGNLTFSDDTDLFDINSTTGVINFTANSSHVGTYLINITVQDSGGLSDSEVFSLKIYDEPEIILSTPIGQEVSTIENCTSCLIFQIWANQTIQENLTFEWTLDGNLNETDYGLSPVLQTWTYHTNFTDEGIHNLTLFISNPIFTKTRFWNITVNHSNAPPTFSGPISNQSIEGTSTTISLLNYFSDIDHDDSRYNQTINFTYVQMDENLTILENPVISVTIDNYQATFSSSSSATEVFRFTAIDSNNSLYNASSNNFTISLTPKTTQTPSSGGGGGGETRIVFLRIIVPKPVSMYTQDKIIVPISLINEGQKDLHKINLSAETTEKNIILKLSKNYFEKLERGKKENLTLTIISNANKSGTYSVIIKANVKEPKFSDSAEFIINLLELKLEEKIKIQEKIIFLRELINKNPECLELKELLDRAEKAFKNKEFMEAKKIAEEAIQACKNAIVSTRQVEKHEKKKPIFLYIGIAFLFLVLLIIFLHHYYQRRKFKKS